MLVFSEDRDWNFHIARMLAEASNGGGDVFEILYTARRIKPGDLEEWHARWKEMGNICEQEARRAEGGRIASARSCYLRASNYYRLSMFFLLPSDGRMVSTYLKSVECFEKAGIYFEPPLEKVEIMFEGDAYRAHFYPATVRSQECNPAVLFIPGADVTKEELYFLGVRQLNERGLSCLCFEGPGQGYNLRIKGSRIRDDYEKPAGAAIDYLQARRDVDQERIGVVGRSFAGYYAVRVAAFDRRVKACVLWGALYDAIEDLLEFYPSIRNHLAWQVGAKDHDQALQKLKQFNLSGIVEKVRCPMLVVHGEDDFLVTVRTARKTYEEAQCEKELKIYRSGTPGAIHCQYDNFADALPYMFDWIESKLRR